MSVRLPQKHPHNDRLAGAMAWYGSNRRSKLPEPLRPTSFQPQESASDQSYGHSSYAGARYYSDLALGLRHSRYSEPPRPDSDFIPPPPAPSPPTCYKLIEYHTQQGKDEAEYTMSGALVKRASSKVAYRVPDRRVATLTASEELPPGIPAQVTFVAAHHCAGCGQPRSHAYHKDNPLIPGQVAPASLCRKCEKKINKGEPIDSIVLPIRDYDAEPRKKRESRRRSTSRTRVVIQHRYDDRSPSPPPKKREPSPEPPKRTVSYRHVHSRSVSRPAPSSKAPEPQKQVPAPAPPPSRRSSSPYSHHRYVIEHVHDDRARSPPRSEAKPPARQPALPFSGSHRGLDAGYYDYLNVDVRDERRTYNSDPGKKAPSRSSQLSRNQIPPEDLPRPPIGLSAIQQKRSSLPPPKSAAPPSEAEYPYREKQHIIYIRRSPSPPRSRRDQAARVSSASDAPSYIATNASTVRPSKAPRDERAQDSEEDAPPPTKRSDYTRYQQYHNRPPSPPPPTSSRTVRAPNTVEYILGDSFKQNPNPAATKAYSEVSLAGSKPPGLRVTFTESEVTSVNGVRVRDERYVTRSSEKIVVGADETGVGADETGRGARSQARRHERGSHLSMDYEYERTGN